MALAHEAVQHFPGYTYGDLKIAHYAISYTAGAITKPSNDPAWMLLNGASLATATYPLLFAKFGYAYGGSGANFNLPDLTEGRIPITKGLTNFTTLGASGGEITHVLTTGEMPSHVHGQTFSWSANAHGHSPAGSFSADGSHNHSTVATFSDGTTRSFRVGTNSAQAYAGNIDDTSGGASANHYHGLSLTVDPATSGVSLSGGVSNAGSGTAHNNMQPYIVVGGWLVMYG